MGTKTIILEGGQLNNQFRTVHEGVKVFEYYEQSPFTVDCIRKQYVATDRYYNGIQVFIPKENKDESNNKGAEVKQV